MGGVPKQHHTKSSVHQRRMHIFIKQFSLSKCPKCGKPALPHTVCFNCGYYKGMEVIDVLKKLNKKERKQLIEDEGSCIILSTSGMLVGGPSVEYLKQAKSLLKKYLGTKILPPIVSKIETPKGVDKIDEIIKETDIVMVARGDLALTAPYEALGVYQKEVIKAAKKAKKQVIVATQILESLLQRHMPTRSEILDLTNIVLDGADGIMFAKETGISETPGYSISVAKKIIDRVEIFNNNKND